MNMIPIERQGAVGTLSCRWVVRRTGGLTQVWQWSALPAGRKPRQA